jgi:hypothetical protein
VLIIVGFQLTSLAQEKSSKVNKLTKGADAILTGKVTHKVSSWNESKTRIYTKTTLQVDEFIKGTDNESSVEVTYPGGEVGDIGELYSHMPRFEVNEEVLVFLKKDKKYKGYRVLNGEEGKIKLLQDKKTKGKVTSSNLKIKDLKSQIKGYLKEH